MKLSIIVPVYNAEKYLGECLDSLVNQTIDDYELILINDGSGDSSPQIIEKYKAQYPELIRSLTVENGGQGRARNIGIKMAKGDYIGFVDSDDWVSAEMFSRMYESAEKEEADMVVCDAVKCFSDGREEYFPISRYDKLFKIDTAVWNKLFKRELIEGIYFPEGRLWYEDLDFVVKVLFRSQKQAKLPEGLYFYRIGQLSTMNNNNASKNLDILKTMEGLAELMLPEHEGEFDSLLLNHVLLDSVKRVSLQSSPDKKRVIGELRAYVKKYIPRLSGCRAFKEESINRRIIMSLNYMGLCSVSKLILKAKGSI